MKLKAIIATLALFVVSLGSANAALTDPSGNNLAFAYFNGNDTSYVLDLGVSVAEAIAGTATVSTNVVTDINAALGGGSITDTSTGFWTILGLPGTERTFASIIGGFPTGSEPNAAAVNQVEQAENSASAFLGGLPLTNGAFASQAADGFAYWAQPGGFQGTFNGFATANGQPGDSLDVLLYEVTSLGGFDPITFTQLPPEFASTFLGSASLDALGNLNFTAVPVPAAVWLFGSAIAAFFGFSRRRTAEQVA